MTDLTGALDGVLAMQRAGEEVEAYGVHRRVMTIRAETGGTVTHVDQSETLGIGVRLVSDHRSGYASSADFSRAGLLRCVEQARSHAGLAQPDPSADLPAAGATYSGSVAATASADRASLPERLATVAHLARSATRFDPRVRVIDGATYRDERCRIEIAATTGLRVAHDRSFIEAWVDAIGDDGSATATASGYWWGRAHADCDPETIARDAVGQAVRLLGPRTEVPNGVPVVLDPEVAAAFITAAGRALVAPLVRSGRGALNGSVGAMVASSIVTLTDDGQHASSKRAAPFDDEGVARQTTPIISAGLVRGMLQSSATRHGAESSTGNAYRGSCTSPPDVAPTTLVLAPTAARSEVVAGDLVHIQQITGGRSGISPVTGHIAIAIAGYVVRNGESIGSFAALPLSTTLGLVLRAIDAVADDARVVFGSPALAPTLRLAPGVLA